jgi:hypothetical protein
MPYPGRPSPPNAPGLYRTPAFHPSAWNGDSANFAFHLFQALGE